MKRNRKKSGKLRLAVAVCAVVLLAAFIALQNNLLVTTRCAISSDKLEGRLVIAHISDLHSKVFAFDNAVLIRKTAALEPDVIVITGDIVSMNTPNEKIEEYVASLIPRLAALAPVYFVSGNHDIDNDTEFLFSQLEKHGAVVLDNKSATPGGRLFLYGAGDPNSYVDWKNPYDSGCEGFSQSVQSVGQTPLLTVLLSHRPEYAELYEKSGADIILCGHAHGGQIRLPFIGGLYAPGQGLLPEYDSGAHKLGESTMIVSRGIGNSVFPLRLFNYPEIVAVIIN